MDCFHLFENIESGECLSTTVEFIFKNENLNDLSDEQFLSLLCHVILKDTSLVPLMLGKMSKLKKEAIVSHLKAFISLLKGESNITDIKYKLVHKIELSDNDIDYFIDISLLPKIYSLELTVILVLIKQYGLSLNNIHSLSWKMAKSGDIFDYRGKQVLKNKKVIRRYPTGGVSEKIALLMPSLLKCLSKDFQFVSPFLVAKTLSFTGGTWDKLSSIPGFHFPASGTETLSVLSKDDVCMTVTKESFNPSDRNIYQLRSITNTVNSMPLIIASIASKQIANPVDTLLLDVRFGNNTFIPSLKDAKVFFSTTKTLLKNYGIETISEFTNTNYLGGSSIGNYLEVIEAICIMNNQINYDQFEFNSDRLDKQKTLVIEMTSKLISKQFGTRCSKVEALCKEYFLNQGVYNAFKGLLESHNVDEGVIKQIDDNQLFGEGGRLKKSEVLAPKAGRINEIYQKKIGYFVNFTLNAGSNLFKEKSKFYDGCLIKVANNSIVRKGDSLATIYSEDKVDTTALATQFFKIEE